tara:strand:+ start:14868 stop:15038 length:171 start_codon:yes stop_codon:yes gene_type:complete
MRHSEEMIERLPDVGCVRRELARNLCERDLLLKIAEERAEVRKLTKPVGSEVPHDA